MQNNNKVFDLAKQGQIPIKQDQNKPKMQNKCGQTIAMILAQQGIIPPKEWYHNPEIKDKDGNTVCYYLWNNGTNIPEYWQDEQYKNPERNEDGETKAMQQINDEDKVLNKKYYHNPNIQNEDGYTVAMILASFNRQIPKEWEHNPNIKDKYGQTVEDYLLLFGKEVPEQWRIQEDYNNPCYYFIQTKAMIMAWEGKIPYKEYEHKPEIQAIVSNDTVAMYLAQNGIIPPQQWRHDKLLTNKYGETVAIILSSQGIIPDDYWMHDVNIQDKHDNNIKTNLLKHNYIYLNGEFKYNIQIETKQETCCICLNDEQQEFIKTICGHNICLECFKELLKQDEQYRCPQCRKYDWFILIDNRQYQRYINEYKLYEEDYEEYGYFEEYIDYQNYEEYDEFDQYLQQYQDYQDFYDAFM